MEGPRKKISSLFPTVIVSKKHLEEEIRVMSSIKTDADQKLQEMQNKLLLQEELIQGLKESGQALDLEVAKLVEERSILRDDKITLQGQIHQLSDKLVVANTEF